MVTNFPPSDFLFFISDCNHLSNEEFLQGKLFFQ